MRVMAAPGHIITNITKMFKNEHFFSIPDALKINGFRDIVLLPKPVVSSVAVDSFSIFVRIWPSISFISRSLQFIFTGNFETKLFFILKINACFSFYKTTTLNSDLFFFSKKLYFRRIWSIYFQHHSVWKHFFNLKLFHSFLCFYLHLGIYLICNFFKS